MPKVEVKRYQITNSFRNAIKEYTDKTGIPAYRLATEVHLHPSRWSLAMNLKYLSQNDIERILKIAPRIGFTGDCYCQVQ